MPASTALIKPFLIPISRTPRKRCDGSRTSPPRINRSNLSLGPIAARTAPGRASAAKDKTKRRRSIVWLTAVSSFCLLSQGLRDILHQIFYVLDADRKAHQVRRAQRARPFDARTVLGKALHRPERRRLLEDA